MYEVVVMAVALASLVGGWGLAKEALRQPPQEKS